MIARPTIHRAASLVALLIATFASPLAQAIPQRTGWVTDEAHSLTTAERTALVAELETFEKRTSHEIAVVVLPTLEGKSIEDESYAIGRSWRVGKEGKDDGVVLVLAMAEHKSRIEVGKGIGDRLTDIESAEILDHIVRPKMQEKRVADALNEGVRAIETKLERGVSDEGSTSTPQVERPWWTTKAAFDLGIFGGIPLFLGLIAAAFRKREKHLKAIAWLNELIEREARARNACRSRLESHLRDIDAWKAVATHDALPDLSEPIERYKRHLDAWDTLLRSLEDGPGDLDEKHRLLAASGFEKACLAEDTVIDKALSETRARQMTKDVDAQRIERAMRKIDELKKDIEQTIARLSRANAAPFEREAASDLRAFANDLDRQARESRPYRLDSLPDLFRRRLTEMRERTSKLSDMLSGQETGLTRIDTAIRECEASIERCERERLRLIESYPGRALGPSPAKLMASLRTLRNEVQSLRGNNDTEAIEICARRIHESVDIETALRDQVTKIPSLAAWIEKEIADENERERLKREGKADPNAGRKRAAEPSGVSTATRKEASSSDSRDGGDNDLPDVGGGSDGGGSSSGSDSGWSGGDIGGGSDVGVGGGDSGGGGGDFGGGDFGGSGGGGGGDFGGGGASSDW